MAANPRNLALIASLALNLALGGLLLYQAGTPGRPAEGPSAVPAPAAQGSATARPESDPGDGATEPAAVRPIPPGAPTAAEYAAWIQDLAAQQLPEHAIRQLVFAALQEEYAHQARQAQANQPYWRQRRRTDAQEIQQRLAWEEEQRQLLRALFGDEAEEDPLFAELFRPLGDDFGFLGSAKQIALHELLEQRRGDDSQAFGAWPLRERMVDRQEANAALRRTIQELLTPEELLEYQLRESRLADAMRRSMDGLDYTEQEFRDIFQLRQQAQLDSLGDEPLDPMSRDTRIALQEARDEADQRVRDYLGDTRYQELQRNQDPLFRSLQTLGARLGHTDAQVVEAYRVASTLRQQIDAVRSDPTLTPEERRSRLQTLNQELPSRLEEVVGSDSAASIQQNLGRLLLMPRPRMRGN